MVGSIWKMSTRCKKPAINNDLDAYIRLQPKPKDSISMPIIKSWKSFCGTDPTQT